MKNNTKRNILIVDDSESIRELVAHDFYFLIS